MRLIYINLECNVIICMQNSTIIRWDKNGGSKNKVGILMGLAVIFFIAVFSLFSFYILSRKARSRSFSIPFLAFRALVFL